MRLLTRLNLSVATLGGTISLLLLLLIPKDPKNAWLLGYSHTRFYSLAFILFLTVMFILGLINTFQRNSKVISTVSKIKLNLEGNDSLGYFGTAILILVLATIIKLLVVDIPEIYKALYERSFPLLLLALWLCLQLLFSLFMIFVANPVKNDKFAASLRINVMRIGLFFLVSYLAVVIARINYPFQLEWVEDGSLQLISRILSGKNIYIEPSLEFVPFIYTPFYFYVSALLANLLGPGFLSPRLISFLASIGLLVLVYKFIRNETSDRNSNLLGVFIFIASYRVTGAWLDIARVDSLYIFLTFSSIYMIRKSSQPNAIVLSVLLATLSILTKQTAIIILAPIFLHKIIFDRNSGIRLSVLSFISVSSSFVLINLLSDGWFSYFTLYVPTLHRFMEDALLTFWTVDLRPFYPMILISLAYFVIMWREQNKESIFFYIAVIAGMTAASWSGRISFGGYDNNLLPVSLGLSISLGLSVYHLSNYFDDQKQNSGLLKLILYSLCLLQFSLLAYKIVDQIPSQEFLRAGEAISEDIRRVDGEVYIPRAPYLAQLAGKSGHAHFAALGELIGHYGDIIPPEGIILREQLGEQISSQFYSAIILNNYGSVYKELHEVEEYYDMKMSFPLKNDIFRTLTGYYTKPRLLFTPDPNVYP